MNAFNASQHVKRLDEQIEVLDRVITHMEQDPICRPECPTLRQIQQDLETQKIGIETKLKTIDF